jgi:NAD dependent epimerase/dehydratase family enzyme
MSHLLLTGQKVLPARLLESGFIFRQPDLRGALEHLLS